MVVHDVEVDDIGTGSEHVVDLLAELGEVSRKDRRRDEEVLVHGRVPGRLQSDDRRAAGRSRLGGTRAAETGGGAGGREGRREGNEACTQVARQRGTKDSGCRKNVQPEFVTFHIEAANLLKCTALRSTVNSDRRTIRFSGHQATKTIC